MPSGDDTNGPTDADDDDTAPDTHSHPDPALNALDYTTTFDPATDSASEAVITTIAALTDTEPTELAPLARIIDPDALDALVERGATNDDRGVQELWFTYAGFDVGLRSDGELSVQRATTSTDAASSSS